VPALHCAALWRKLSTPDCFSSRSSFTSTQPGRNTGKGYKTCKHFLLSHKTEEKFKECIMENSEIICLEVQYGTEQMNVAMLFGTWRISYSAFLREIYAHDEKSG
jgi:hypothetical protein